MSEEDQQPSAPQKDSCEEKKDNIGTNDLCTIILQFLPLHEAIEARQVCRRWWFEVFDLIISESQTSSVSVPVWHFGWGKDNFHVTRWGGMSHHAALVNLSLGGQPSLLSPKVRKMEAEGKSIPLPPSRVSVPWLLPAFAAMFEVLGMAKSKFAVLPTRSHSSVAAQLEAEKRLQEQESGATTAKGVEAVGAVPKGRVYSPRTDKYTPGDSSQFHAPGSSPALPVALPQLLSNMVNNSGKYFDPDDNFKEKQRNSGQKKLLAQVLRAHNYVFYCHIATDRLVSQTSTAVVDSEKRGTHVKSMTHIQKMNTKLSMFRSPDFSKRLKYFIVNNSTSDVLMKMPEEMIEEDGPLKVHPNEAQSGPSTTYAIQLVKDSAVVSGKAGEELGVDGAVQDEAGGALREGETPSSSSTTVHRACLVLRITDGSDWVVGERHCRAATENKSSEVEQPQGPRADGEEGPCEMVSEGTETAYDAGLF